MAMQVYVWFGLQNVSECLDTTIVSVFTRIRKARRVGIFGPTSRTTLGSTKLIYHLPTKNFFVGPSMVYTSAFFPDINT
jgi:hypothetical protein